jgi:uncharacterized protein YoaH (UPF0181 family)
MIALDRYYEMHLNWMYENQPQLVRRLLKQNKLHLHLDNKMQQALKQVDKLTAAGMSSREAFDLVDETILAPADGPATMQDPAPKAIPPDEQKRIWDRLEAQVEEHNRREAEEMN